MRTHGLLSPLLVVNYLMDILCICILMLLIENSNEQSLSDCHSVTKMFILKRQVLTNGLTKILNGCNIGSNIYYLFIKRRSAFTDD